MKLGSTMSQEALAQLEESIINNVQRLRDEVLNLKDFVIKILHKENQKLHTVLENGKQDHRVRKQS